MTNEDIIRMARESGLYRILDQHASEYEGGIERFAKQVMGNIDPKSSMSWQEGYEAGVLAEREACAKRLDALGCDHCAAAIRLRGKE